MQPNIPGEILCNVNRYFWCLPDDRQDGGYKDCDSILNSHAVFWNVLNFRLMLLKINLPESCFIISPTAAANDYCHY